MIDIAKIDPNFAVKTKLDKKDIRFYNIDEPPFHIYGIFRENDRYRRIPEDTARRVSDNVYALHANTAGGRVRFWTDSSYIAIHAIMEGIPTRTPHSTLTSNAGFDLYTDNQFRASYLPPVNIQDGYESICGFSENKLREITIIFPSYSNVKELYIGLQAHAAIDPPSPYKNKKPIVYYGSSITNGGCASRPGMTYQSIISRRFHCDYINLGFGGSAKAEDTIIEYIKNLDMSLFVYDYDYNAPTVEYLRNTHWKMFSAIRSAHPELPIIMMSRPKLILNELEEERRQVIESTYHIAVSLGDSNVYFIDGRSLMKHCGNDGTVDTIHPTDYGFASMAKVLGDLIEAEGISAHWEQD